MEYVKNVLDPKSAFLEDIIGEENVVTVEKDYYQVPKFMLVTMKLVGGMLVCDDKEQVSVINPSTMQKQASIPLPTQNCYLYSGFYHESTSRILLAYDNKQLAAYDSNWYNKITSINLNAACMKFTEFHGDPANFVILACEDGVIQILQPSTMQIIGQYSLEDKLKDEKREEILAS